MIRDFLNAEDDFMNAAEEASFLFRKYDKNDCEMPPMPQKPMPEGDCKCDMSCVDTLPVGSMYAPMQVFRKLYSPEEALCRGTLFSELDLPFRGGNAR